MFVFFFSVFVVTLTPPVNQWNSVKPLAGMYVSYITCMYASSCTFTRQTKQGPIHLKKEAPQCYQRSETPLGALRCKIFVSNITGCLLPDLFFFFASGYMLSYFVMKNCFFVPPHLEGFGKTPTNYRQSPSGDSNHSRVNL